MAESASERGFRVGYEAITAAALRLARRRDFASFGDLLVTRAEIALSTVPAENLKTNIFQGDDLERATGFEPVTFSLGS